MKKLANHSILLLFCVALLGLTGCVTKTDMQTMQMERQQDLNRIKQLEAELEESKQLLKEEIDKSNDPLRARSADMWAELQALRTEFAKLRGQMDELHIRLDRQVGPADSALTLKVLEKRLHEVEFAMENQLSVELPKGTEAQTDPMAVQPETEAAETDATAGQPSTEAQPAAAPEAEPPADTDPAKALYDKAYALYKAGQYEKARSYWAEFTDTFKDHSFTPSATFWQGQCYYQLKDYARAVILFEDVIEKFKKSSKYKSALLKAGYSWSHLGKPELAKLRLQEVIKAFPKSVEATQAKRTLEKM
ncbi:MAG: tetratricopeptide repeat protein [Desulfovibrionaceae bacterium]|nr:tetratricopeptide repeat protein [Desulfovibrionaceae bacterium]